MKVLYLHMSPALGGAPKSLLELWNRMREEQPLEGVMLCPRGPSAKRFREAGMAVVEVAGLAQWDNTRFSYYRGLRWLVALRELALWPATLFGLLKSRRSGPFDLVHVNEVTLLLPGVVAKRLLRAPLIVHVRSLQRSPKQGLRTRVVNRTLARYADAVVAIDEAVRRTLPAELPVSIVRNIMRHANSTAPRADARFRVAMIGMLNRSKGLEAFVEAARLCSERGMDAQFLIVGENARSDRGLRGWLFGVLGLAQDTRGELETLVRRYALEEVVSFTGYVDDIAAVYRSVDVVCFPSSLDAPGRPVIEAAHFGIPSIVAMRDPTTDVIVPGVTGLCIAQPDPVALAQAIERLYRDPEERERMGQAARRLAETNFNANANAGRMLEIYRSVLRTQRVEPGENLEVPSHAERTASDRW